MRKTLFTVLAVAAVLGITAVVAPAIESADPGSGTRPPTKLMSVSNQV